MPEQFSSPEPPFADPGPGWGLDALYFFHSSDEEVEERLRNPGKHYGDLSSDVKPSKEEARDVPIGQTSRSIGGENKRLEVEQVQGQNLQVGASFPRLCSRYRHEYTESNCDPKLLILDMGVLAGMLALMDSNIPPWILGGVVVSYCLWRFFCGK